jgi:hypothetical protein
MMAESPHWLCKGLCAGQVTTLSLFLQLQTKEQYVFLGWLGELTETRDMEPLPKHKSSRQQMALSLSPEGAVDAGHVCESTGKSSHCPLC